MAKLTPAERARRLGEQPIPGLLLRMCLPAMVGMATAASYNFVDGAFVGHINEDALAGVTAAMPYMLVLLATAMLVAFGGAALLSTRLGEGRHDDAERILGSAAFMMLVLSVVLTIAGLCFLDTILGKYGLTGEVLHYARDYLRIIIYGTTFQIMGYGLNAMIRSEGNARIAMYTMLIGVILNALLAYIFIFDFRWATKGAALATVLSQGVSALWVILYFTTGQSHVKLRWRNLWPDARICGSILYIGSPMFLRQSVVACMGYAVNRQLAFYGQLPHFGQTGIDPAGGDMALAVFGSIYRFMMLILMPVFGVNQGTQPVIAYNFGARRFDRVKKALLGGIGMATTLTAVGFLIAMAFPGTVLSQFIGKDNPHREQILALGVHAIRIFLLMLPLLGIQVISASYFQAVGKPKQAMVLMIAPTLIFLIPLVFILPRYYGLEGVWMAQPISDFGSFLITGAWLLYEISHLRRRHDDTVAVQGTTNSEPGPPIFEKA